METTVGLSASNMSIYTLVRDSNRSWRIQRRCFQNREISDGYDHGSTINGDMAKWRLQLDSACRIGLSTS